MKTLTIDNIALCKTLAHTNKLRGKHKDSDRDIRTHIKAQTRTIPRYILGYSDDTEKKNEEKTEQTTCCLYKLWDDFML